jgi:hypothetical protein
VARRMRTLNYSNRGAATGPTLEHPLCRNLKSTSPKKRFLNNFAIPPLG